MSVPGRRTGGEVHLVVAAVLFGSSFLVTGDALDLVEPVPFLGVRFALASALLWSLAGAGRGRGGATHAGATVRAGAVAGLWLTAGYLLQTVGLEDVDGATSAFLTYLLIVIVPLLEALRHRVPPEATTVAGVAIAVAGLVLLTGGVDHAPGRGELLTVACALFFALHVVAQSEAMAHPEVRADLVRFNAVQLTTVAAICLPLGATAGGYDFPSRAWWAAAYLGVFVSAAAFGLMLAGQRHVTASRAALLLLLEPVAAAVLEAVVGRPLDWARGAGAGLVVVAVVVAEVLPRRRVDRRAAVVRQRLTGGHGSVLDS